MKKIKSLFLIPLIFCLTSCFEVEDNNEPANITVEPAEVVIETTEVSTTVRGKIVDASTGDEVSTAQITVKLGDEVLVDDLTIDGGDFEIENLPNQSDLEIIVSSATDLFMSRTYYFTTDDSAVSVSNMDIGFLTVSESITVSVTVLDQASLEPVTGLEFWANSNSGSGSSEREYFHLSTYNDMTGEYEIEVPKFLSTTLYTKLDIDGDGVNDYSANYDYDDYYYNIRYITDEITGLPIYFIANANVGGSFYIELESTDTEAEQLPSIEYRVVVLNEDLESLTEAQITISEGENTFSSIYDEATGQHVVTAEFDGSLTLDIPSFETNGITYQSAAIYTSDRGDSSFMFYSSNAAQYFSYGAPEADSYDLVIQLEEQFPFTNLDLVLEGINTDTNSYFAFYSEPVQVDSENVSFESRAYRVTRGDEDDEDFVLPGNTVLTSSQEVQFTVTSDLNNTRLTITPDEDLSNLTEHYVEIGMITALASNLTTNISGDALSFDTEADVTEEFSINDLRLDNGNYHTNGEIINAENTAGIESTQLNYRGSVQLILPDSINNLNQFSMNKTAVTYDGVTTQDFANYELVTDGVVNTSRAFFLDVARNEIVTRDGSFYISYLTGYAEEEGDYYYRSVSETMYDNTDSDEYSITFEYVYETVNGDVETGTITLPVN